MDESVRRLLRDKFALGLFENPYVKEDPIVIRKVASEGSDLSRRLAAESVTLLKNDKNLLPLGRDIKRVAVIGPHADSMGARYLVNIREHVMVSQPFTTQKTLGTLKSVFC